MAVSMIISIQSSLGFYLLCLTLMIVGKSVSGASTPVVPAVYIFGDSVLDSGNNNFLENQAKSNFAPYGIDFPNGQPTGKATNGATAADFIAQFLGLPYPPAYLSLSEGDILTLYEQINYFNNSVTNDLPRSYSTPTIISATLARSMFIISTGSNDYMNNYLQPQLSNSSQTYTPRKFANLLFDTFEQQLTTIYKLGGRKFLVVGIGAMGCSPIVIARADPKPTTLCVEDINNSVNIYNNGLLTMLQRLASRLQGFTFVRDDLYKFMLSYADGRTPCCKFGEAGTCIPGENPCNNRDNRLFYDAIHPVQVVYYRFARDCFFRNSALCTPINIQQLALKQS
ncbi:hypothetical protein MKW92_006108 [Papaver armeniacum]|nr:hypothetical protein MKW92_006108 [Papaver armeniacum]